MSLHCTEVAFTYPGAEHPLFTGVSFCFDHPGFHAFFGPSGAGKTSLARIISGEIACTSGTISRNGLGRLLYSHNKERLPGWSGVDRHLQRVIAPAMQEKLDQLIELFGLTDCIQSRFDQLSMGQQNRVNLIRYLLQDCDLLIMDESLANVDEITREKIILVIKSLFPNRYFIYISHHVMEVAKFCDSILVLRSSGKTPQTRLLTGCNTSDKAPLLPAKLDATLLEIMNAA